MKHQTRAYTKKNPEYWNNLKRKGVQIQVATTTQNSENGASETFGSPFYTTSASYERTDTNSPNRNTRGPSKTARYLKFDKYSNIDTMSLPFTYSNAGNIASARDPIILCQKAYFHVGVFRNTIDLMSEFANDEIYLEGGGQASQNLTLKWLERIGIENLKRQFFREYFRSGNVFLYRLFGDFSKEEIASLRRIYASTDLKNDAIPYENGKIPLRFLFLNPSDIYNYSGMQSGAVYKKVLNPFEIQRLKNPETTDEKKIWSSLTEEIQDKLGSLSTSNLGTIDGVYIDLEPDRLITCFYKKQDYEPFAIPFGFPVLEDINWKLELKKIDQAISRSVENMVLLITAGAPPDKGGINPNNMKALKDLFANEAMGRVLVADYTTNAEFIIPDIKKIVGKEKYEIVNEDIKEGLQNILFDDAKYQNTQIKTKVFFGKLKEARDCFINDFLQVEVQKLCQTVGFKDFPLVKFRHSDITSQESIEKTSIRLLELGIFDPEMAVNSIRQGKLPDPSGIKNKQKEYVDKRMEGWYSPLVGGTPLYVPEGEDNTPTAKTKLPKGRPSKASVEEDAVSKDAVSKMAQEASSFESRASSIMKKDKGIKRLSQEQKTVVSEICKSIVMSSSPENWEVMFKKFVKGKIKESELVPYPEVSEIAAKNNLDIYASALVFHAKQKK